MFAKKYKIKLSKNGKLKTMQQLAYEIYDYELNHTTIATNDGLYFKYQFILYGLQNNKLFKVKG